MFGFKSKVNTFIKQSVTDVENAIDAQHPAASGAMLLDAKREMDRGMEDLRKDFNSNLTTSIFCFIAVAAAGLLLAPLTIGPVFAIGTTLVSALALAGTVFHDDIQYNEAAVAKNTLNKKIDDSIGTLIATHENEMFGSLTFKLKLCDMFKNRAKPSSDFERLQQQVRTVENSALKR